MKRITNWKPIAFAIIVPLLIALQPAISFACDVASHTGCG